MSCNPTLSWNDKMVLIFIGIQDFKYMYRRTWYYLVVYLIKYISFDYKTSGKFSSINAYECFLTEQQKVTLKISFKRWVVTSISSGKLTSDIRLIDTFNIHRPNKRVHSTYTTPPPILRVEHCLTFPLWDPHSSNLLLCRVYRDPHSEGWIVED